MNREAGYIHCAALHTNEIARQRSHYQIRGHSNAASHTTVTIVFS